MNAQNVLPASLKVPPVSVKDEGTWQCVYCGKEVADERAECCGEVGHTEFVTEEN